MSNPTTPFGWQMPTATDLVTDLPADFEVFGQAVATSMADLLGGTTGQILSKTSNTDMDFTWTTPNPGDITGVTAGTGISGGGTSGDVTITNSMATAMTTSGDLIQATGSGTFARLATGTAGQYLTTNGTTNSWGTISAGGMTLISTTTFTGASITLSSIPSSYKELRLITTNVSSSIDNRNFFLQVNGITTATYDVSVMTLDNTSYTTNGGAGQTSCQIGRLRNTGNTANGIIEIPQYTSALPKWIRSRHYNPNGNRQDVLSAYQPTTSAITSITLFPDSGNFSTGTALLYGVN